MHTYAGRWLHGFLDLCLLSLLAQGPDYGYGLSRRLASAGLGELPGGTMYPALLRLEQQGFIEVGEGPDGPGPRRRYYRLTPPGRQALQVLSTRWGEFRDRMDQVVPAGSGHPRGPDGPDPAQDRAEAGTHGGSRSDPTGGGPR